MQSGVVVAVDGHLGLFVLNGLLAASDGIDVVPGDWDVDFTAVTDWDTVGADGVRTDQHPEQKVEHPHQARDTDDQQRDPDVGPSRPTQPLLEPVEDQFQSVVELVGVGEVFAHNLLGEPLCKVRVSLCKYPQGAGKPL
jgi:hypothetical protein